MKSIRRTLILNVMLLLVLALGTVSVLVYRITNEAIQEKQRSASDLVEEKFREQRDEAMINQARALASDAESLYDPIKFRQYFLEIAPLGMLALPFGGNGHITAPLWLSESLPGPLSYRLHLTVATDIKVSDLDAMNYGYVQVNSDWGNSWRSSSLSGRGMQLDMSHFNTEQRIHWIFDDIELTPGVSARRIRMKAPLSRFRVLVPAIETSPSKASLGVASGLRVDPYRPGRIIGPLTFNDPRHARNRLPPGRPGSLPPPPLSNTAFYPTLYIQIAWDKTTDHPRLLELEDRRRQELTELDSENTRALNELKKRLAWIIAVTFVIVMIGGWLLVGSGLAPLQRLSHAVSQVSPKDFLLPIDPKKLPLEVSPVAERLKQTLELLQEAFAREKRASADISHELRTPLAALTTTLEVALRKPRSNEDYRQTIDESRQIARQLSHLVQRMLMLAWLDAGADEIRSQPVDVDQLVEGCAAIGKPLAEAQGLRFQISAEKPLTVNTDPDKLREVVMNLLHNAIEYNQPGGEVELSARHQSGGIVVEVRDTGIGIPSELYQKIFERFYRGDPSRNAAGVHAGLGLAIVKEYVDRLRGHLSIESIVGRGSRFRVELPNE